MISIFPAMLNRAGSAIQRFPSGFSSTFRTVFVELCRRGKFATMYSFVARNTYCQSIINVKARFIGICKRLDMVGVKLSRCSAYLAGIVIPLINRLAPLLNLSRKTSSFVCETVPIFPCGGILPNHVRFLALFGAIFGAFVFCVKVFSATLADFYKWFSPDRPAFFGAISWSAIRFIFKGFSTNFTGMVGTFTPVLASNLVEAKHRTSLLFFEIWMIFNPTYLADTYLKKTCAHKNIITHSPHYCSFILERMATAFPGIEIERM